MLLWATLLKSYTKYTFGQSLITLIGCLSVVLIIAQLIEYSQVSREIQTLSASNLTLLSEREEDFAKTCFVL